MHDKLSKAGAELLSTTIPALVNGEIVPVKQNDEEATFAYNIKREQERINWSNNGEVIYNHIRGLHPWPVAFTYLNGQVLKVWWGEKVQAGKNEKPGVIIRKDEDGFVVSTGNEIAIKITDLQISGKTRVSGEQFMRGAGATLELGLLVGVEHENES